ncbi:MAG: signal peptide peptidase SppA [Candidatus Latescibacteria bacterium]|nr:signal peptide peptidase SppA [Candidatus Latescibacterota bacterium]
MGFAQIQEVRDAVLSFRQSGKPTIAYAETFGEGGTGNGSYYLASAFETIYLQPSGDVGLTGLRAEHPFVKGLLDTLDIEPRMAARYEYKNAMNLFTEEGFTESHREATEVLLQSMYDQIVGDLATALKKTPDHIKRIIDQGPILGVDAVALGLVSDLAYRDEVYDRAQAKWGTDAEYLSLSKYANNAGTTFDEGTEVALIYGVGQVTRGKSDYSPASGSGNMGSDTVAKAFRDAVKDDGIKAIVFRIDSPGGSYVASDAIWREVEKAKAAGKPVIATMGNVAASGGYFVAMNADKVIAQPGTITGSIGVLAGKMLTDAFWKKLGVTWDYAHVGESAYFWSSGKDFTPEQWAQFNTWLDRVYVDFTQKAADGRGMSREDIHAVAKGRVWTGVDAKNRGLVDELGGFQMALNLTREALDLGADAPIELRVFPKEKTLVELVLENGVIRTLSNADVLVGVIKDLRPVFQAARAVGLTHQPGVVEMRNLRIE